MKTLVLCVDRDDDLGVKAGVETPVVGRRRVLDAASRLGTVDPEDSDVNALFAGVRLYDRESKTGRGQVEVAAVAGHRLVGLRSDRILAKQLEEVLELTRADEVVLVSDGAEDEQILPILASRVKVAHVHRSIVKQAPRLEGFYYVLTRMLDDEKIAKRYVLPLGIIMLVWATAFWFNVQRLALGLTLGIVGSWLVVHALKWEDRLSNMLREFGAGLRTGKLAWIANVVMVLVWAVGAVQAYQGVDASDTNGLQAVTFIQEFLWWFVLGLLVHTAGRLFDEWMRDRGPALAQWTLAVSLIAFGLIASVGLEMAAQLMRDVSFTTIFTFELVLRLAIGLSVAMGGLLVVRHFRQFAESRA